MLGMNRLSPTMRKIVAGVVGTVLLVAGVAMIVLPGPAFVVIPLGLIVLSTEFKWARKGLEKLRDWFRSAKGMVTGKKSPGA